jgi:hypothetical protein
VIVMVPGSRPPVSGNGFLAAVLSAPGLAAITFMVGALALSLASFGGLNGLGSALINAIFLVLIATVWGAIPSFVFGGLVLATIRRIPWRGPPDVIVYLLGGVVAAGLYVLVGLGIARLSTGAAMFFAPWATPDLWPNNGAEAWGIMASLLLAGALAGLIYAAFAKRG